LNRKSKQVQLCGGVPRFDLTVMDFVRWGIPGRDHHADWFQTIDHPDAHLIAAAPTMLEALELVDQNFKRNDTSGNFLGDDEHEAWAAVTAALAKARGGK
jgi:hypothetical protein